MIKNTNSRSKFIHLYNPKEEGLGLYDVNYINAYRKQNKIKVKIDKRDEKRCAA